MRSSRGFALIVVLWFLVLIAAISAYLLANARHETAIARNILAAASAEALADAGVAQAAFNLTSGRSRPAISRRPLLRPKRVDRPRRLPHPRQARRRR